MSQYNILVVDDDREIVRSLGKLLELEGYRVKKAYNGMEALDILMTEQIHLILLDVMMPKMNGLSALMKIREKNNIPIIMLSAKTEESDKVIGLSMGADDYVTKPYNTAELMARVKSQLRRYFSLGAANGTTQSQDILKNGGLLLNRNTKEIGNANLHFITGNPFITLIHGIRRFGDPKFLGNFVLGSASTQFPKFLANTHICTSFLQN